MIEPLEPRIAPAVFASFPDVDGDLVTVTISKGAPPSATSPGDANIVLSPTGPFGGLGGSRLLRIDLLGNPVFQGASITVTAKPQDLDGDGVLDGDGLVNVGFIDASGGGGIDLGTVKIEGDVGKLLAGDGNLTTTGLASLSVLSIGRFGVSTGAPDVAVTVTGKLGAVKVPGDVSAPISATNLGAVTIGGNLTRGGLLGSNGIGPVKIAGDVGEFFGAPIESGGKIASMMMGGRLLNSSIVSAGDLGPLKIGGTAFGNITSGGRIASITVGSDARAVSIESAGDLGPVKIGGAFTYNVTSGGSMAGFTIAGDWSNSQITAAGDIGPVKVGGSAVNAPEIKSTAGRIAGLAVAGMFEGGLISSAGALGPVRIGGDASELQITSGGDMGLVTIGGTMPSGAIDAGGKLVGVNVGGDFGNISVSPLGRITSGGDMGAIKIGGDLTGRTEQTGRIFSGGDLASVTIGGSLVGGTASDTGQIIATGTLGSVKIGGDLLGGGASSTGTADVSFTGYIQGASIKSVFIAGSIRAGFDSNDTFSLLNSASIRAVNHIGSVTVLGALIGRAQNDSNSADGDFDQVTISARGKTSATGKTDLAIGKISIGGRMELSSILAGYDVLGDPRNADAQIGSITVGGDLTASNIVAGVTTNGDDFGNANDAKISGVGVKDTPDLAGKGVVSKIARVVVKGSVLGTVASNDSATFGIVAQQVGKINVGGAVVPLTPGASNDLFAVRRPLGTTLGTSPAANSFDFHAFEVA